MSDPFKLAVPSVVHMMAYLITLLQVVVHVSIPSLPCEGLITDLVKKVPETMRSVLNLALSPMFSLSPASRAKTCEDVLVLSLHLQQSSGLQIQSAYFSCFLVRYRLYEGPKDAWNVHDQTSAQLLQDRPVYGISKAELLDIMKLLCLETWDARGVQLRVRRSFSAHFFMPNDI